MPVINIPVGIGQTYTTIAAAVAACPTGGADTWLLQLLAQAHPIGGSIDCTGRLIEGIEAAAGAGVSDRASTDPLRFSAAGARIDVALGGGISTYALSNLRAGVFIRNIQVTYTNNQNRVASFAGGGRIERCIVSGSQDWQSPFGQTAVGVLVVANTFIITSPGGGQFVDGTQHTAGSTIRWVNCVFASLGSTTNLRQPAGLTVEAFNCMMLGQAAFSSSDVGGGSNNISVGAAAWGASSVTNAVATAIVSAWPGSPTLANIDVRTLVSGAANAAGIRRQSDTLDVDVYNRARPIGTGATAPSMGAWESNSGPSLTVNNNPGTLFVHGPSNTAVTVTRSTGAPVGGVTYTASALPTGRVTLTSTLAMAASATTSTGTLTIAPVAGTTAGSPVVITLQESGGGPSVTFSINILEITATPTTLTFALPTSAAQQITGLTRNQSAIVSSAFSSSVSPTGVVALSGPAFSVASGATAATGGPITVTPSTAGTTIIEIVELETGIRELVSVTVNSPPATLFCRATLTRVAGVTQPAIPTVGQQIRGTVARGWRGGLSTDPAESFDPSTVTEVLFTVTAAAATTFTIEATLPGSFTSAGQVGTADFSNWHDGVAFNPAVHGSAFFRFVAAT